MTGSTLIQNGWIVSMDPEIGELRRGSILIEGERIVSVAEHIDVPDGCTVIEAEGMIVHPGFVDTHKHLWQTPLRGAAGDMTLVGYFSEVRRRGLSNFRPQDAHLGTLVGALELINGGTTSVLDHSHGVVSPEHADALAEGELASGIRGIWAYGYCPVDVAGPPAFESHADRVKDAYRAKDAYFSSEEGGRLRMGIAATEQNLLPLELTVNEIRSALDMDAVWTGHTHCGPGNSPITRGFHTLVAKGLIDHHAVLSHCNEFGVDDFDVVRDLGAHFASSPDAEISSGNAHGAPFREALLAGVQPSLGTDCVVGVSGDMYTNMRVALIFARHQINIGPGTNYETLVEPPVTTRDVFRWATSEGARALGLAEQVGSLTPGKYADLVLVDARALNLAPVLDPVVTLVMHAHAGNVDTVILNGQVRKRGGKLVDIDLPALLSQLDDSRDYLLAGAEPAKDSATLAHEAEDWSQRLTTLS